MKKLKKKIEFLVEITSTGYSAYSENIPVYSTGENVEQLTENILEASNQYFEELGHSVGMDNLKIRLDLQEFFKYYRVLNAKFLAQRIGMNPSLLSQYVQGKKRPSTKQSQKIISGIQAIGEELAAIDLA